MKKTRTPLKRKYRLSTKFSHKNFFKKLRTPKKGERTFKTIEGANKWATGKLGLKEGQYTLSPAKKGKKFKIEK